MIMDHWPRLYPSPENREFDTNDSWIFMSTLCLMMSLFAHSDLSGRNGVFWRILPPNFMSQGSGVRFFGRCLILMIKRGLRTLLGTKY